ncbi:hypothetical protein [Novipirellula sp.]|uniref:hypothetical protein n=1 Tax=Novipirellula sp. TaxID=2795430 RepID=UPI003567E7E4
MNDSTRRGEANTAFVTWDRSDSVRPDGSIDCQRLAIPADLPQHRFAASLVNRGDETIR